MPDLGPVTCAGCGLCCDDVALERAGASVRLAPECALGAEWFSARMRGPASAPAATVGDRPAQLETALIRAAELLRDTRRPLLHGFQGATVEDARAAVALADRLGALVATDRPGAPWPGAPAVALRGACTATLGEIRDRSRLVVIWREDPVTTHPRLLERLGFRRDLPSQRPAERTLAVIDERDTPTAQRAALRLRWAAELDLEALSALHVMQRGSSVRATGLETELRGLLERVNRVPHAAFVYGPGLTAGAGGERRALALHELVRELSHARHVVTLALPGAAGTRGAQDVLSWQTGYSGNVDLGSGHPVQVLSTGALVRAEGVDLALRIEGAAEQPPDGVAEIALGSRPVPGAAVWIRTAAAGVQAPGTVHRLDGVPVALQAPLPDPAPTAAGLLSQLLAEVHR